MWGHELGKVLGARIPAFAVEHQYLVTDPIPDLPKNMPTMRDPDLLIYWKPEVRGIAFGGYEPNTLPFARNGIPPGWDRRLMQENYDRFEQLAVNAAKRTPIVGEVGVRVMINGAIPISADGDFVMGKLAEYRQRLRLLRVHLRHRGIRRRGLDDGGVDLGRPAQPGPLAAGCPAFPVPPQYAPLHV